MPKASHVARSILRSLVRSPVYLWAPAKSPHKQSFRNWRSIRIEIPNRVRFNTTFVRYSLYLTTATTATTATTSTVHTGNSMCGHWILLVAPPPQKNGPHWRSGRARGGKNSWPSLTQTAERVLNTFQCCIISGKQNETESTKSEIESTIYIHIFIHINMQHSHYPTSSAPLV